MGKHQTDYTEIHSYRYYRSVWFHFYIMINPQGNLAMFWLSGQKEALQCISCLDSKILQ